MNNKYQEALDHIGEFAYEHDLYDSINTLQDLVDNYGAMYEQSIKDAKFLKEVVEPHWEEVVKASPVKILQATNKDGEFVGDTTIEPDYEKALDKACDRLEMYCVEGIIQEMDLPYDLINVIPTRDEWKEWLLKDE